MSLQEWKKRYYPVPAEEVAKTGDVDAMLQHALLKWSGLKPNILKKYKLGKGTKTLSDANDQYFVTGGDTCALCLYFNICSKKCPLYDCQLEGWFLWILDSNPTLMLQRIKKAIKERDKKARKE